MDPSSASSQALQLWLFLDLSLVLLLALSAAHVCLRIGVPVVVGELLAGIAIGPSVLGQLAPELAGRVVAPETAPVLTLLAHIGVNLFVVQVGAELRSTRMGEYAGPSLRLAGVAFALPMGIGLVVGFAAARVFALPAGVEPWAFAGFLGLLVSARAFPVLARVLDDLGERTTRVGTRALTTAGLVDLFVWVGVAVMIGLSGGSGGNILMTVGGLAILAAACRFLVRPILVALADGGGRLTKLVVPTVIVTCMTSSSIAQALGADGVFGALICGVCLPAQILRHGPGTPLETIQGSAQLFIPIFFVLTGAMVDLTQMSLTEWAEVLLLLITVVFAKSLGVWAGVRSSLEKIERRRLVTVMNCLGMTDIVIVQVGVHAGLLPTRYLTYVALLAAGVTALVSILLRTSNSLQLRVAQA